MKSNIRKRRFALLAVAAAAGLGRPESAVAVTWAGTPGSFYSTPSNWSNGFVPAAGDAVITNQPQFTAITSCNFDYTGYDGTHGLLANLIIEANQDGGFSSTAIARLTQATAGYNMFATNEALAAFGGPGQYVQSAANNTAATLTVGGGYSGLYSLSGTGLLSVSGLENIGGGSTGGGTFIQSGGTHTLSATASGSGLAVGGPSFSSAGTYNLSAGTLSSANEYIAYGDGSSNGSGQFNQTGGTNNATTLLSMGVNKKATGVYSLSGGTLTTPRINIGEAGVATFNATGGTMTVGGLGLFVGNGSGSTGTFNLAVGASTTPHVTINSDLEIGQYGNGIVTQSAGFLSVAGGTYMAIAATATATYDLSGGTFQDNYGVIGYSGNATFSQSGGTHTTAGLLVAEFPNSNGTLVLSSNAVLQSTAEESLGYQGHAIVNQSGGSNSAPTVYVGGASFSADANATATYNLSGGTLSTTTFTVVSNQAPGTFAQTGGTHTTPNLYIAEMAGVSGTYSLSNAGSALTTSSSVYVGYNGPGTFTQTGGTNTVNGSSANGLYVGYSTGATGTYTLNSGAVNVASNLDIGVSGTGTFNNNGGDVSTLSFYLGVGAGMTGTYNMTAGSLTSNGGSQFSYQMVGYYGTGSFNQHGGTNTLGTAALPVNLYLGYMSDSAGTYTMDETSGTSKLIVNGDANIGVGSDSNATFSMSAGTMSVGGSVVIANASSTGKFSISGGSLSVSGQISGTGSFSQTGGTANVAQLAMSGPVQVSNVGTSFSLTKSGVNNQSGALSISNATFAFNTTSRSTLTAPSLTLGGSGGAWTGKLDLGGNDLIVTGGDLATITNQIGTGFNSGNWLGSGITSSTAAGASGHLTALGVIRNNDGTGLRLFGNSTTRGLFDGTNPALNSILVRYTYYGDANLDGKVDGNDYSLIDFAYTHPNNNTGWQNGDFNYDGKIDGSDYSLIDNTFNRQGTILSSAVAVTASEVAGASVPEPAMIPMVLLLGGVSLARRRKRYDHG